MRRLRTWQELIGEEIPELTSSLTAKERRLVIELLSIGDRDMRNAIEIAERIADLIPFTSQTRALEIANEICVNSVHGKWKDDMDRLLRQIKGSRRRHVRGVIEKTIMAKFKKLKEG